jgi:hypothetical protein
MQVILQICYNAGKCDPVFCRHATMQVILQICYNAGKCDAVFCRYATMHANATLYSADTPQCSTCGAVLLCGTPLDWYKRTKQCRTVVLCGSIFCKQASYSELRISWSSPVSTSERHLSIRKCGTHPTFRTVPYATFTIVLLHHSLPSPHTLYSPSDHTNHCDMQNAAGVSGFHMLMRDHWDSSDHFLSSGRSYDTTEAMYI